MREDRLPCVRCGTATHEWQTVELVEEDGELVEVWRDRDPAPWGAELWRCKGCEALDHAADEVENMNRAGLKVRLTRRDAHG